jgi:hypothetical protein
LPGGEFMEVKEDYFLSEEVLEWIGLKKSEYLSQLITHQQANDFPITEFHQFDTHIPMTIQEADNLYELQDEDYPVRIYIKAYAHDQVFTQIVLGAVLPDEKKDSEIFVPILSFITKDEKLVRLFSVGVSKTHPILN